ncbi:hypothetical protein [Fimbriiglobus ruber]|uniref:Uncharacterized protein n=1 Tax=Fimbriiglobus ruber TaxID=1908690 RepID=A0A225DU95_9BACT|nr:hypothetical protein [Fimbriiglobus ruber]OWK42098.1 hypothetical protein FRUB_04176 [Fimbriiglobus ruber]
MGLLENVFNRLADAVKDEFSLFHIESLCSQLGWGIDERLGDWGIVLHFKDSVVGIRKVNVVISKASGLVVFSVLSAGEISTRNAPGDLAYHLLARNGRGTLHSWHTYDTEFGKARLVASYSALIGGLNALTFSTICEALCHEVNALDLKLQQCGMI